MRHISIILVEPQGDANIGAVARAMKNFGITDLRLVNSAPHLTKTSYMWSVEAKDVLEHAQTVNSLEKAITDAACSVAFTRRLGKRRRQHMSVKGAARWIQARSKSGRVALVFGREDRGLTSEEINLCDIVTTIPTSRKLPSLNLAQAVIIACHELFSLRKQTNGKSRQEFISKKEMTELIKRFSSILTLLGYENNKRHPLKDKIVGRLEKIFGRAGLSMRDARMFEGLISRIHDTASSTSK